MNCPPPDMIGQLTYGADFQQQSLEGNPGDADTLSLFLPTLVRMASACGDYFDIGIFEGIDACGEGHGFSLRHSEDSGQFTKFAKVLSPFSFTDEEPTGGSYSHFPVSSTWEQLAAYLTCQQDLIWYGFRKSDTNEWLQDQLQGEIEPEALKKTTMMVLQANVLLKDNGLPRRRCCLRYSGGSFWCWAAYNDDYLMASMRGSDSNCIAALNRAGNAFILHAATQSLPA